LDKNKQLISLFEKFLHSRCTEEEVKYLFSLFEDAANEEQLKELIFLALSKEEEVSGVRISYEDKTFFFKQISAKIGAEEKRFEMFHRLSRKQIYQRVAAAAVLVGVVFLSIFFMNQRTVGESPLPQAVSEVKDIPAGTNNAVLTLSDGTVILLDSVSDGQLAQQQGTKVIKIDDKIAYTSATKEGAELQYNTITTARGNQYQLILSDGTKVWLNAQSSIRFPVVFARNERRVDITGEVYFEVARDVQKPFRVMYSSAVDPGEIEVLGTHFNINAYPNERAVKTTLVEGRVRIKQGGTSAVLLPEHEATWSEGAGSFTIRQADVDVAVAWKEGYFEFHDAEISDIMRQFSRWYDIEVEFRGNLSKKLFSGSIRRQATLLQALEILKISGIQCELNNRTVIIQ
jgi:ferric-dicitrate binding protein FerR (iron transport regulator)